MDLNRLIKNVEVKQIIGSLAVDISDVKTDSNLITKGCLFVCNKGKEDDGKNYVKQAEKYGAAAVVCDKILQSSIPQIIVDDTRKALSIISAEFYSNPARELKIIGVVGTNGKTTTSHLIGQIINFSGIKCGVIGTLGSFYSDKYDEPTLTTPDPMELNKTLRDMLNCGVKVVVMEVSAHAIYWEKVYGIDFEVGVFTNFSRDHLDFFQSMEEYKKAKLKFFNEANCKYVVVNSDDPVGVDILKDKEKAITYGLENPADVFAIKIKGNGSDTRFVLNLFDCIYRIEMPLVGRYNLLNALAAATACSLVGVSTDDVAKGLKKLKGVTGRLELVYDKGFKVYVDYAHTPDGIVNALKALRPFCENRLITVFGCGGNRDKGKRELMGEVAKRHSDFLVVTSDNPRYEEPMMIISEIEKGVLKCGKEYVLIEDRADGIEYALNMAKEGDLILVAGKGGESYQDVLGIKQPYNDKDTINELLLRRKT